LKHANGVGGAPAWSLLPAAGGPPAARQAMARGYDPATHRLVIFGGQNGTGSVVGNTSPDVWVLTNADGNAVGSTWTLLSPGNAPPPGQYFQSSWYDAARNRLIVAGGVSAATGAATNAVWALTNANGIGGTPQWINLIPEGAPGSPSGFAARPAAYDAASNRAMIVEFGTTNLWLVTNANGLGGASTYSRVSIGGGPGIVTDNLDAPYDAANHRFSIVSSASQIFTLGSADATGPINPSVFGQPVTFTATVSPIAPAFTTPTGTVTFKDGATTLGAAPVNASRQATFTTSSVSPGSARAITAAYDGSTNFTASTSSSYSQTVTSAPGPTAAFSATPNPAACSQTVAFDGGASSASAGVGIASYAWTFGDGTSATAASVTHAYSAFGTFTATLTVTDNNVPPKTSSVSHTVSVSLGNQAPVANPGGPYVVDLGAAAALNGTGSTDPNAACGDSIAGYAWTIDAGAITKTGAAPSLTAGEVNALGAGSHGVSLTVTDTFGVSSTAATSITIYDNRPIASFSAAPNPAACGQAISFNSTSLAGRPDRAIVSYAWQFGDGSAAAGSSATHAYAAFGNYTATLTVTDNNVPGKTAAATQVINLNQGNQPPNANAGGPYTVSLGSGISLNGGGSSDPNAGCGDPIASYAWSIDGGTVTFRSAPVPTWSPRGEDNSAAVPDG
jgi:PKD repeat protein